MDPGRDSRLGKRQYSQNTTSSYSQATFPSPAPNRTPFSSSPHATPGSSTHSENNRRLSDPYFKQQRSYGQEVPLSLARHQIGSTVNRGIATHLSNKPPPSSPQQHAPSMSHQNFGHHPPLRASAASVGQSINFAGTRDHPNLPNKGGVRAGGMAIADILGGPSLLESKTQYSSPVKATGPIFIPTQPSSRPIPSRTDYSSYRRPQTPDLPRQSETRDIRMSSGASPAVIGCHATPEAQGYETPQQINQSYIRRGFLNEERRDNIGKISTNTPPAQPNGQPNGYNITHSHDLDRPTAHIASVLNRRVDLIQKPTDKLNYGRPISEETEKNQPYPFTERERSCEQQQEREPIIQYEKEKKKYRDEQIILQQKSKEREKQERKKTVEHENNTQDYPTQASQLKLWYSQPSEQRDWIHHGTHELPRPAYEPISKAEGLASRRSSIAYENSISSASQLVGHTVYSPNEQCYNTSNSMPPRNNLKFETNGQERQSNAQQTMYNSSLQNSHYPPLGSQGRKQREDIHLIQQRNFLSAQDINRKERVSPLPQTSQSLQLQADGLGGEPSIKNEFGRMFSGIGSGVGRVLQVPSQSTGHNLTAAIGLHREDLETLQELQTTYDPQSAAVQGSKRRKPPEGEKGDEEISAGRITPNRSVKRSKIIHQQSHHRLVDSVEPQCSSQLNLSHISSTIGNFHFPHDINDKPSANLHNHHHHHHHHHHHAPTRHHHHHHSTAKNPAPSTSPPTANLTLSPKLTIVNDAILDSVAKFPRYHLGHGYYHCTLRTSSTSHSLNRDDISYRGFASKPDALPLFTGRENCTYTVKIPRIYLEDSVREEVTNRKALWGTDIYTDDSDILAACIHGGWFRGAWHEDVDITLLGLELKRDENGDPIQPDEIQKNQLLECPSEKGPGDPPSGCDCHVTILILPLLERYASSTRFGIRSREWGFKGDGRKGQHDGLSFMIKNVRFVSGVDGEEGRSRSRRCKIIQRQLQEKEADCLNLILLNENLDKSDTHDRSDFDKAFDIKGLGQGGWWKRSSRIPVENGQKKLSDNHTPSQFHETHSLNNFENRSESSTEAAPQERPEKETTAPSPTAVESPNTQRSKIISKITKCMIKNATHVVSSLLPVSSPAPTSIISSTLV